MENQQTPSQPIKTQSKSYSSLAIYITLIIVLGLVVYLLVTQITQADKYESKLDSLEQAIEEIEHSEGFSVEDEVNNSTYQAVFLRNGQVYFGKLMDSDLSGQVELTNIYYLQTSGEAYKQGSRGDISVSASEQVSLAKLGDELHGPEDVMYISRDEVSFWENMKPSSEVVQAINNHQGS